MMMGVVGDTCYHHTETLPMRLSDFVVQDIQLGFFVYYFFLQSCGIDRRLLITNHVRELE